MIPENPVLVMNRSICLIIIVLLPFTAHAFARDEGPPSPSSADIPRLEQRMLYLINLERKLVGVKKLEWNGQVAEAARAHARLLAERQEMSHRFQGEPALSQRLGTTGVRFTNSAENIASADNEDEAHLGLMYSPGHRDNILDPQYSAVGVGVALRAGRIYVTEDFISLAPSYSEEQFRNAFVDALKRARESKGMGAMLVKSDPALHDAACSTDGEAGKLVGKAAGASALVVFTLSKPEQLPEGILKYIYGARIDRMSLGVCFRPDDKYGHANFWVVAAFSG